MEMKSTEKVLNFGVSFDANSVIIPQFSSRVNSLVLSFAAIQGSEGRGWSRPRVGLGVKSGPASAHSELRATLWPVAAPPPPHRHILGSAPRRPRPQR